MKRFKLFVGILLLAKAVCMLTIAVVLSVQKKPVHKAVYFALGAAGVGAILFLTLGIKQIRRDRRMRAMDAFCDYDYCDTDDDCDCEDFGDDSDYPGEALDAAEVE